MMLLMPLLYRLLILLGILIMPLFLARLTLIPIKSFSVCCVFFFQAEDGIRDLTVTGVQTCALPIYFPRAARLRFAHPVESRAAARAHAARIAGVLVHHEGAHAGGLGGRSGGALAVRSEERRVGKECRSRWSPYH